MEGNDKVSNYTKEIVAKRAKDLIKKRREGQYWDFKQEWHSNKARLLHDILCIANNPIANDGYIIIGVNDDGVVCGVDVNNPNRQKQADIIDWLSNIKFASDTPDVLIYWDVECDNNKIDLIFVPHKNNGPYFVKEKYKKEGVEVLPYIYTRNADKNTSITQTASFSQMENLWRQRLGLLDDVQKMAIKCIYDLDNWEFVDGNSKENAVWYYKSNPDYTITSDSNSEIDSTENENTNSINSSVYYLCVFLNIGYHSGVAYENIFLRYKDLRLFEGSIAMVDECRTKVLHGLGYFIKNTLSHGMYEFVFAYMCGNYSNEAKRQIETIIPIYESESEKSEFEKYTEENGWCKYNWMMDNHNGNYMKELDLCTVNIMSVIGGMRDNRNIEYIETRQKSGELFNFYSENEIGFSEKEREIISNKLRENFVLVKMLVKWRTIRAKI